MDNSTMMIIAIWVKNSYLLSKDNPSKFCKKNKEGLIVLNSLLLPCFCEFLEVMLVSFIDRSIILVSKYYGLGYIVTYDKNFKLFKNINLLDLGKNIIK